MRRHRPFVVILLAIAAVVASAQTAADRQRARIQAKLGWEFMKAESWEAAAKSFQQAIDIDKAFEDAHYGLGRARMALKQYVLAIESLTACADLYKAQAGRQFANQQEAQRYRQDRLTEIDEQIRQLQSFPQTMQTQDQLRQINNQRRDIENALTKGSGLTVDSSVPPWVTLSLGSAYFRSGKLADAEREYRATIAVDNRAGEAHNNLAVVLLETGRFAEADAAIKAAKKVGFKVHPQLEQDIRDKLKK